MKQITVVAKGQIPEWFRDLTENQQQEYLDEHPNSELTKTVKSLKAKNKTDDKQKEAVKKQAEKELKEEKEKETTDKDSDKKSDVQLDTLADKGSPSNFRGPRSKGDAIGDNAKRERRVVSELDKLAKMVKDAKAKGKDAPTYNLCEVSIPGTNLFCGDNVGIPRTKMPQLKGKPVPGSWAEKNLKEDKGEVSGEDAFVKMLSDKGVKMEKRKQDVSQLKASQLDMRGDKVAGMYDALKNAYKKASEAQDPKDKVAAMEKVKGITAPIFVSKDGYILDGHHRWAAHVGVALADGIADPIEMETVVVDMEIKDLIKETNDFCTSIGIAQNAGTVKASFNMFGGCQDGSCNISIPVRKIDSMNSRLPESQRQVMTAAHYRLNITQTAKSKKEKADFVDFEEFNIGLREEMLRVIKILNKRGRLMGVRRVTNVDSKTVCAVANVVRSTQSLSVLEGDLAACGYSNTWQTLSLNTKRPVAVYAETDMYVVCLDTHINMLTLIQK